MSWIERTDAGKAAEAILAFDGEGQAFVSVRTRITLDDALHAGLFILRAGNAPGVPETDPASVLPRPEGTHAETCKCNACIGAPAGLPSEAPIYS